MQSTSPMFALELGLHVCSPTPPSYPSTKSQGTCPSIFWRMGGLERAPNGGAAPLRFPKRMGKGLHEWKCDGNRDSTNPHAVPLRKIAWAPGRAMYAGGHRSQGVSADVRFNLCAGDSPGRGCLLEAPVGSPWRIGLASAAAAASCALSVSSEALRRPRPMSYCGHTRCAQLESAEPSVLTMVTRAS